jgi:phage regulator Rha-like protein
MRNSQPAPAAAIAGNRRIITRSERLPEAELIGRRIHIFRSQKVMLDSDLAGLYHVETKALNRAVKRNLARFPGDFMFQLTDDEAESLRCQNGTSKEGRGGRRTLPYAFTEHGVAMLSSVLNSERAVQMNIPIVRAFVRLRQVIATHRELARKMERLETTQKDHAAVLTIVVKDIQTFEKKVMRGFKSLKSTSRRKQRIGFIAEPPVAGPCKTR